MKTLTRCRLWCALSILAAAAVGCGGGDGAAPATAAGAASQAGHDSASQSIAGFYSMGGGNLLAIRNVTQGSNATFDFELVVPAGDAYTGGTVSGSGTLDGQHGMLSSLPGIDPSFKDLCPSVDFRFGDGTVDVSSEDSCAMAMGVGERAPVDGSYTRIEGYYQDAHGNAVTIANPRTASTRSADETDFDFTFDIGAGDNYTGGTASGVGFIEESHGSLRHLSGADPSMISLCTKIEFEFEGRTLVVKSDDTCGFALGFGEAASIAGTYTWKRAK